MSFELAILRVRSRGSAAPLVDERRRRDSEKGDAAASRLPQLHVAETGL